MRSWSSTFSSDVKRPRFPQAQSYAASKEDMLEHWPHNLVRLNVVRNLSMVHI